MSLVDHARYELEAIGQFEEDPAFAQSLVAAVAVFASYRHSGGSAGIAIQMLADLLRFTNLSPLTTNPDEWQLIDSAISGTENLWQNRRNGACFSKDGGLTYYCLDDPKNEYGELPTHSSKEYQND